MNIRFNMGRVSFIIFLFLIFARSNLIFGWTWVYDLKLDKSLTNFAKKSFERGKDFLQWTEQSVPRFRQLIFSWNAFRPVRGYFSFWVQVRDSATKRWYGWHEIAHWGKDLYGKNLQRSLTNITRGTSFHYVRLELPRRRFADAFRVKVQLKRGANLENIKKLIVNIVNNRRLVSEVGSRAIRNLSSTYIKFVPRQSQMILDHPDAKVLCSPTSTSMLLGYLLKKEIDPIQVARGSYDSGFGIYGSWPFNIAHAFELCKGKMAFHVERLASFKNLHDQLKKKIPVIVSVRGPLRGSATPYASGHLLVVIGYDRARRQVICHDPAFSSNKKTLSRYDLDDFLKAWERSERLAYIASFI